MPEVLTVPAGAAGGDQQRRRALGAFYTPAHAVTHMVGLLTGLGPGALVLEPSGGDGAFVAGLTVAGVDPTQIHVWDVDPAVGERLTAAGVTFSVRDSLLNPGPDQYSHVIGNPPYLNKQSDYVKEHRAELTARYADIGANDTYAMFTTMGLDRLRPDGQLVFLVSDTFLTLGIYRRFRERLLEDTRIDSITLLPTTTVPDAAVRTAILALTRTSAPADHQVRFHDLRTAQPGDYTAGTVHAVTQRELLGNPGKVFAFTPAHRRVTRILRNCPTALIDLLDGGLGMYTRDNAQHVAVVTDDGVARAPGRDLGTVPADAVDGQAWRAYHKRGGTSRWYKDAEHAVRWDTASRARYGIPATSLAGTDSAGQPRPGVVVSGISTRLSARLATPGAMWESNKAFGLFPQDPSRWPAGFFLAVLNSRFYDEVAKTLNHTVSLQFRDLAQLPLLPFTEAEVTELAALAERAVTHTRNGNAGTPPEEERINAIVDAAAERAEHRQEPSQ